MVDNGRVTPTSAAAPQVLDRLEPGMALLFDGNRMVRVSPELAAAFTSGDRVVVVPGSGAVLHIPAEAHQAADDAVTEASGAFAALRQVGDEQVTRFYQVFAARLQDEASFAPIAQANIVDVEAAKSRGRSTTRLVLSERMRSDMVAGLLGWAEAPSSRGARVELIEHDGWSVEQVRAGLGVVGFVFEGRPNVFADATGVLRSGNTVVFRIGSDALGTARAIVEHALDPALAEAGLPPGAVRLLDSASRAAGWALFGDRRLGLAVARGSGQAVFQLGAVARQAGVPVSLHGTGGAWMVAGAEADPDRFAAAVENSLDRKVCNTLNVAVLVADRAAELAPRLLDALESAAARRGTTAKLHVAEGSEAVVPVEWFERTVQISRAEGPVAERQAEVLPLGELGREWEWEDSPELSLVVAADLGAAIELINQHSPRLVASLISEAHGEQEAFFAGVDLPFVGDGFTRWVDGQYALGKPELGLSNWESGRLFARGAVLAGDSVFTVRTRVRQTDAGLHR
jgi:glutamate-5-semialdehyde dehydrogenase